MRTWTSTLAAIAILALTAPGRATPPTPASRGMPKADRGSQTTRTIEHPRPLYRCDAANQEQEAGRHDQVPSRREQVSRRQEQGSRRHEQSARSHSQRGPPIRAGRRLQQLPGSAFSKSHCYWGINCDVGPSSDNAAPDQLSNQSPASEPSADTGPPQRPRMPPYRSHPNARAAESPGGQRATAFGSRRSSTDRTTGRHRQRTEPVALDVRSHDLPDRGIVRRAIDAGNIVAAEIAAHELTRPQPPRTRSTRPLFRPD